MATAINVPFSQKEEAKTLGARWNANDRTWYVPDHLSIEPFRKWLPSVAKPISGLPATRWAKPDLFVDLVPETAFHTNLRAILTQEEWGVCKKLAFQRARHVCEVCGGHGPQWPVEAHERWSYDEVTGVQTLVDLVALCPDCHESSNMGLANVRGRGDVARAHLMKVKRWSVDQMREHVNAAYNVWERRSKLLWKLDATVGFGDRSDEQPVIPAFHPSITWTGSWL